MWWGSLCSPPPYGTCMGSGCNGDAMSMSAPQVCNRVRWTRATDPHVAVSAANPTAFRSARTQRQRNPATAVETRPFEFGSVVTDPHVVGFAALTTTLRSGNSDGVTRGFRMGGNGRRGHAAGMPDYRRLWVPGGTYAFTANLADRSSRLLVERFDALRNATCGVLRRHPFEIVAWVAMPNHLHAVWTMPGDDCDFALRWMLIKQSFSRAIPACERISKSRQRRGERGIWQRRYWERLVRNDCDLENCIDYIHNNPVKHGFVKRAADWPYSSFHRYVLDGRLPKDWAGAIDVSP